VHACPSGGADAEPGTAPVADAVLALNRDKSPRLDEHPADRPNACPTPRLDRAYLTSEGEVLPIPCSRNACPHCRRRNVQVTAAMMGLNAALSTTRHWADEPTLREGWRSLARRVRREVHPDTRYAWFREWTTGRADGIRRTHYHSIWSHLTPEQGQHVAEISREVWSRLTGAYSTKAHGSKPVWDAGGLARYIAGLAGHHLKADQAPPPGWSGRRFGTSRGFYATDPYELRREATHAVRDERLRHHLERAMVDDAAIPDQLPADIWDELLTARLEEARNRPPVRVIRIAPGTWTS
jgi:hypothetical protein